MNVSRKLSPLPMGYVARFLPCNHKILLNNLWHTVIY